MPFRADPRLVRMFSRQQHAATLRRAVFLARPHHKQQQRFASQIVAADDEPHVYPSLTEAEDPEQNGGYQNPPAVKRQFRDPHGDWWDKQERRRFGEPVHERDDELQMLSLHDYTFTTPGVALFQIGCFAAAVLALCGVVLVTYPDRPSVPRQFEGGLDREYGGAGVPGALSSDVDWRRAPKGFS